MRSLIYKIIITYCLIQFSIIIYFTILDHKNREYIVNYIDIFEKKMTGIKENIPENQVVGFIRDLPGKKNILNDLVLLEYFLIQYNLAPNIIAKTNSSQFIVAKYRLNKDFPTISENSYKLIFQNKHGISLYWKEA